MGGQQDTGGIERRANPRCPYSGTAIVYAGNDKIVCRAVDISAGGLLIVPPKRRERASFLRINLSLPSFDEVLDLDAIVVRETEVNGRYAWGVAFHQPEPRAVALLGAFVQWAIARCDELTRSDGPGGKEEMDAESRRDTPTSLAALGGGQGEFSRLETYGGGASREVEGPLPGWSEKDDKELEQLFNAVLADLDERS